MPRNFDVWKDTIFEKEPIFIIAFTDQKEQTREKWVLTTLTEEEAKKVYEYLKEHFE